MPSILSTVRDLDRLRQIVLVLVRHGFGEIVQRAGLGSLVSGRSDGDSNGPARIGVAERVRLVLQDLGPSFVKLGQIVSTRPDLVPENVVAELQKLQDEVPPISFDTLRPLVEAELGAPLSDLFAELDETPLASASIAQVHRGKLLLPEGVADIVVKIQRPNVKSTIEGDIDLLHWLARAIERSVPESRTYSPVKLVAEFDRAIHAELDFNLEADHAERFARNFEGDETVKFPAVYRSASARSVLTLEYLPGKKVFDAVAAGASGEQIAKRSVAIIIKQIFEYGFFHADPHPGNVLIMGSADSPIIGMIDLGLVGRLSPRMRDLTVDLMVAAVRGDHAALADALYAIGRPTRSIDRTAFDSEVALLSDRYLGKRLKDIQLSAMIRDLVQGATRFGLEIPPDFLLVGKALMTVEGIGKQIYPDLDVFEEVKPYFLDLLWRRYSPEKLGLNLWRGLSRLSGAASVLPVQAQELLDEVRRGTLTFNLREAGLATAADRLGRRIFSGLVVASTVLSGAMLLARGQDIAGYILLALGGSWALVHASLLALRKSGRPRRE